MRRALHYVLKVTNRQAAYDLYVALLGMKVLRHEEFTSGCEATCNGPYKGFWSKTMVGYDDESSHFVLELTYNYGVESYQRGNDLLGIFALNTDALKRVKQQKIEHKVVNDLVMLTDVDGHKLFLAPEPLDAESSIVKVALAVANLSESVNFWSNLVGMTVFEQTDNTATLGYSETQCQLELNSLPSGGKLLRGTGFGRIAFSAPTDQLAGIQLKLTAAGQTILTPLVTLATPGKADVSVVIVADPNGHEICYVGDEGFRQLSQIDPEAERLLLEAISADRSETGHNDS